MKYHYGAIIACTVIILLLLIFPLVNPCQAEDAVICTWQSAVQGNGTGWTFTDFYGITLYWHYAH